MKTIKVSHSNGNTLQSLQSLSEALGLSLEVTVRLLFPAAPQPILSKRDSASNLHKHFYVPGTTALRETLDLDNLRNYFNMKFGACSSEGSEFSICGCNKRGSCPFDF